MILDGRLMISADLKGRKINFLAVSSYELQLWLQLTNPLTPKSALKHSILWMAFIGTQNPTVASVTLNIHKIRVLH